MRTSVGPVHSCGFGSVVSSSHIVRGVVPHQFQSGAARMKRKVQRGLCATHSLLFAPTGNSGRRCAGLRVCELRWTRPAARCISDRRRRGVDGNAGDAMAGCRRAPAIGLSARPRRFADVHGLHRRPGPAGTHRGCSRYANTLRISPAERSGRDPRLLGRHSRNGRCTSNGATNWSGKWRFCDDWGQVARFDVLFDGMSGIVRTSYQRPELRGFGLSSADLRSLTPVRTRRAALANASRPARTSRNDW